MPWPPAALLESQPEHTVYVRSLPDFCLDFFTHQPLMWVDRLVLRAEIWSAVRPMPVR